jgi:endogenous inhibitor of DNA gyrase (YacG/DUF329 family)/transcription elongation factor Elf1
MKTKLKPPYKCANCGVLLGKDNWYKTSKKHRIFVCKKCHDVRVNKWEHVHMKETRIMTRNWCRKNLTTTWRKGKQIVLVGKKRDYPKNSKCELCKNTVKKNLAYHHWDDKNVSKGLWLCFKCHMFAEVIDKLGIGIVNVYHLLKLKVEPKEEK